MTLESTYEQFKLACQEATDWFANEIAGLRTGRVKINMVEDLPVEHYGARTPLKGLASISLSDARTMVISPWDPTAVAAIEKAIMAAQVGVQPVVDGKILRLSFPSLTEELREQTIKQLHKKAEEARVKCRLGRDQALDQLKKGKQDAALTEDDFYEGRKKLDDMIDKANEGFSALIKRKEEEIRTV